VLEPGTTVSIPLDENLTATGPPSEVVTASGEQALLLCQLYGVNCPPGEESIFLGIATPTLEPLELTSQAATVTSGGIVVTEPATSGETPPTTIPPPPTEPPATCGQISVRFSSYGKFQIKNNSSSPIVLTKMTLSWPDINGRWTKVFFGKLIGSPNADTPPATHSFSGHLTDRTLYPGDSKTIRLEFMNGVKGGQYAATFYFDNGCARFDRN
jgi:hypothetical protein